MMLEVHNATVTYTEAPVVCDVSLSVTLGTIVTVIGSNGAGKTTTLRAIVGAIPLLRGQVAVDGQWITRLKPNEMLRHGVALVPEGRGILAGLTVAENLLLGAHIKRSRHAIKFRFKEILNLFPSLQTRLNVSGSLLSGGEQQMLAIARALMGNPKYLLLDEPSMGLAPAVVKSLFGALQQQAKLGIGILLVEQNAQLALSIADKAYVIERGQIHLEGSASELKNNELVKEAYLGWG